MGLGSLVTQPPSHRSEDGTTHGKSFLRKGLAALTVAGLTIGGSLMGASAAQAADLNIPDEQLLAGLNYIVDRDRPADTIVTSEELQAAVGPGNSIIVPSQFNVGSLDGLEALDWAPGLNVSGTFDSIAPLVDLPNLTSLDVKSPNLGPELPETVGHSG